MQRRWTGAVMRNAGLSPAPAPQTSSTRHPHSHAPRAAGTMPALPHCLFLWTGHRARYPVRSRVMCTGHHARSTDTASHLKTAGLPLTSALSCDKMITVPQRHVPSCFIIVPHNRNFCCDTATKQTTIVVALPVHRHRADHQIRKGGRISCLARGPSAGVRSCRWQP